MKMQKKIKMKTCFLLAVVLAGCARPIARFALRDPVWVDPDRNSVPGRPEKYFSGHIADGADQIFLRPLSRLFAFPLPGEATNANSLDEVADSAWFENRIGFHPMTPAEVGQGVCGDSPPLDPAEAPWTVVVAKPDGANPGFFIKAKGGQRYLLKFDGSEQPQRATAADVIGSKLYHAAGYNTPCNIAVYFPQSVLHMDPGATRTNEYGEAVPMTDADVEKVLSAAFRRKDGWLRASASRFLPGTPLGPFRYEGTRDDDPNDVVPHDERRELRGGRLFAAWLNHFDAREQNSLDVWVEDRGRSYIRHYLIDWGDCLGSAWAWDAVTRRLGYSGYFDYDQILTDVFTLGLYPRPWNGRRRTSGDFQTFGYFSGDRFVPSQWRAGYDNPAFMRMTMRDALWATRIISRFTDADIAAAVSAGHLDDPRAEQALVASLIERRQRILAESFGRGSALDRFLLVRRTAGDPTQSLCFEDRALATGVADPAEVVYRVRVFGGTQLERTLGWLQFRPDLVHPQRSCMVLPIGHTRPHALAGDGAPPDAPLRYNVIEIQTTRRTLREGATSVRLHLYDLGPERGYRLAGIERPEHVTPFALPE